MVDTDGHTTDYTPMCFQLFLKLAQYNEYLVSMLDTDYDPHVFLAVDGLTFVLQFFPSTEILDAKCVPM